jgi:hypothetical protein
MKYFLLAGVLGFGFWIASELIEIYLGGYNASVYYLTALYHVFAGFGIWGLHKAQSGEDKNTLSMIGAAVTLIAYIGFIYFPIAMMQSGLGLSAFLDANPIYKIPGGFWFLGMILFGVSILKTKHFPAWTGIVFLLGTLMFTATPLLGWPAILANATNIIFALNVIYMCFISLQTLENGRGKK